MSTLPELMDKALEVGQAINGESPEVGHGTRKSIQARWSSLEPVDPDDIEVIKTLPERIGTAHIPDEPRRLSNDEVDSLMGEVLTIRHSQDILQGRHDAIRSAVYDGMDQLDPEQPGPFKASLASSQHHHAFERRVSGGKAQLNVDKLWEAVDPEVWSQIATWVTSKVTSTITVYKTDQKTKIGKPQTTTATSGKWIVDEDALVAAVSDGRVTLEQLSEAVTTSKKTASFHVVSA